MLLTTIAVELVKSPTWLLIFSFIITGTSVPAQSDNVSVVTGVQFSAEPKLVSCATQVADPSKMQNRIDASVRESRNISLRACFTLTSCYVAKIKSV